MFICLFYTCLVLMYHVRGFIIAGSTHYDKCMFSLSKSNMTSKSNKDHKKIVIIIGPTATGKTKFSIDLCKKLREFDINPEIVNADSMQVYKGFAIGTAKPSDDEVKSVPHHLIDFVEPTEDYNASLFVKDCSGVIDDLFSQNKLPVIVGGTNLYIEGLLWPSVMDFEQNNDNDSLDDEFAEYDSDALHDMLMEIDPDRARDLHKNDRKRIIRSLDVYHYHGMTHTELMKIRKREREATGIRYDVLLFLLKSDPEIHRQRIKDRVKSMLRDGILDECKQLMSLKESNSNLDLRKGIFQSIAYKELMPLLTESGEFNSNPDQALLDKCAIVLENKTWQYSQRQKTWINNRLMKYDLKSSVVDTNDIKIWEDIIEEKTRVVMNHLNK